VNLANNI